MTEAERPDEGPSAEPAASADTGVGADGTPDAKQPSAIHRAAGAAVGAAGAAVGAAGGAVRTTVSGTKAFWTGGHCVFRGVGRLISSPHLWPYGIMPVAVAIFVFVGTTFWLVDWLLPLARSTAEGYLGETGGVVAVILTFAALIAASLVAVYAAFPAIVRVIAAPFLALLADRAFEDIAGVPPPTPPGGRVVRWVIRPIAEALVLLAIRLTVTVIALPLICIPVIGAPLFFCVLLPLEGMDLLDLAMSARAVPLQERLRFVRGHIPASAGLGLGAAGVLFVPILNVFFLPALVVGAVMLDRRVSPDFPVAPASGDADATDPDAGDAVSASESA